MTVPDLWGAALPAAVVAPETTPEPAPSYPVTTGADGHLEIPAWASEWYRKYLADMTDLDRRDASIRQAVKDNLARARRRAREHARWVKGNPLVAQLGAGPSGATCGACVHLYKKSHHAGSYFKCDQRGDTNGPGTDHRKKWAACACFETRGVATCRDQ